MTIGRAPRRPASHRSPTRRAVPIAAVGLAAIAVGAGRISAPRADAPHRQPDDAQIAAATTSQEWIPLETCSGGTAAAVRITRSGRYRATAALQVEPGRHAVLIAADNVEIDFRYFPLISPENAMSAIAVVGPQRNIAIRHARLIGWDAGAIRMESVEHAVVDDVYVAHSGHDAIVVGPDAHVRNCRVVAPRGRGIVVGRWSVVEDATVENARAAAFEVGLGARLRRCVAVGAAAEGFSLGPAASAADCEARENNGPGFRLAAEASVIRSLAIGNARGGFLCPDGGAIISCRAERNSVVGFLVDRGAVLHNAVVCCNDPVGVDAGPNVTLAIRDLDCPCEPTRTRLRRSARDGRVEPQESQR